VPGIVLYLHVVLCVNKPCKSKADDNVFKNMFVGMDVHKNYLQVVVLDEKGKILNNSRVDNNLIKVNEFFSLHPELGPYHVVANLARL
jgi:hypothetical protein